MTVANSPVFFVLSGYGLSCYTGIVVHTPYVSPIASKEHKLIMQIVQNMLFIIITYNQNMYVYIRFSTKAYKV